MVFRHQRGQEEQETLGSLGTAFTWNTQGEYITGDIFLHRASRYMKAHTELGLLLIG